jgi:succinoglycan biosynthesis protein ExoO
MLVSIIIPVCEAEATIPRTLRSLLAQTWTDWEAVIVIDDGRDYESLIRSANLLDPRMRFSSTGLHRSGCHHARNVGLSIAAGDLVGMLDADDTFHPHRLALLAPVAQREGAAADNLAVIADADSSLMYRVMGPIDAPAGVDIAAFSLLTAPVVPLVRRDHAQPRTDGVEYAEDVIGNLRLIDRLGRLTILPEPFYDYRIRTGSIANAANAGEAFEQAYSSYIERLASGDGFGLSPQNREAARIGLLHKRTLNRKFQAAFAADRSLNFQSFVAGRKRAA